MSRWLGNKSGKDPAFFACFRTSGFFATPRAQRIGRCCKLRRIRGIFQAAINSGQAQAFNDMSEYVPDNPVSALKVPPHSLEAEQSVLGGLMLDDQAWFDLIEVVAATDFYRTRIKLFLMP